MAALSGVNFLRADIRDGVSLEITPGIHICRIKVRSQSDGIEFTWSPMPGLLLRFLLWCLQLVIRCLVALVFSSTATTLRVMHPEVASYFGKALGRPWPRSSRRG